MAEKTGEAYTFFDCKAPIEYIERELPTIRELVETPNKLELDLLQTANPLMFRDKELKQIARDAGESGLKYAVKASCSSLSNKETADELAGILNQAYLSPLFEELADFRGGIYYKTRWPSFFPVFSKYASRD